MLFSVEQRAAYSVHANQCSLYVHVDLSVSTNVKYCLNECFNEKIVQRQENIVPSSDKCAVHMLVIR